MSFAPMPITPEGARVVQAAEGLHEALAARVTAADVANQICRENYLDMQRSGIAAAFVPQSLGGMGLDSMHDWILTIATLAEADPSAAIAISMHLSATRGLAGIYHSSQSHTPAARRARGLLEQVAAGEVLICSTTTERGTDNLHPLAEATSVTEGWQVSGHKHFVTMSPLATHVATNVRMRDASGDHIANVLVPMDTAGIEIQNDWDALGMRASGSHSVKFDEVLVPHDALRVIGPWGSWSIPVLVNRTLANVPLVGAFLGIAKAAQQLTIEALSGRAASGHRAGVHHTLAEMELSLAPAQAILARLGERLDVFMRTSRRGADASFAEGHELMKDYQSAKWIVNRNAIAIVSQAMDLAGGGGFLARNPLARLYRDVRAGPFMQPYSPVDAREYMGRVLLGDLPAD